MTDAAADRVETLFGFPTRRFVKVSEEDPRDTGDVVRGDDGRDYLVTARHRFVEDHMLGDLVLEQTRSTVLFVERLS